MTDNLNWRLEHDFGARAQILEAPTGPDENGHQGVCRKLTELIHVTCNCGFSSGWVQRPGTKAYDDAIKLLPPECYEAALRKRDVVVNQAVEDQIWEWGSFH